MADPEGLFEPVLVSDEIARVTSSANWVQKMVDVECSLARAQARLGMIPASAAEAISLLASSHNLDPTELGRAARSSATPVIPLVRMLTAKLPKEAMPWIHYGATSQDILDTATMLVAKESLEVILNKLFELCSDLATLAERHRDTIMVGRTLMQHALPYTFGLKSAVWLSGILDSTWGLERIYTDRLAVQIGGAGGTLAAFGNAGTDVVTLVADDLGLNSARIPWHSQRQRMVELGSALVMVNGTLAKMANDIALASQAEIGELVESLGGGGGSSAMPQKVNPVGSIVVNAGFRRSQGLLVTLYGCLIAENERGAGEWQAEWQSIQELLQLCGGVVSRSLTMVDNLSVNESRMLDNLQLSRGNIMSERVLQAMTRLLGRTEAHDIIRQATIQSALNATALSDELQKVEAFSESFNSDQVQELFDPFSYLGSYNEFIDRTLDHWQEIQNTWKVPSGDRNMD